MTQRKIIELLTVLVRGCRIHRSYRAIKDPKVSCRICQVMRVTRKKLNQQGWPEEYQKSIPAKLLMIAAQNRLKRKQVGI